MSSTDEHTNLFIADLTRIHSLAQKFNRSLPFMVREDISPSDIVAWLGGRKSVEKWYWKSRNGDLEIGGIGRARAISGNDLLPASNDIQSIVELMADDSPIFICGQQFGDSPVDKLWSDFPDRVSFVPERMIIRNGGRYQAAAAVLVDPQSDLSALRSVIEYLLENVKQRGASLPDFVLPVPVARKDYPEFSGWKQNVQAALEAIEAHRIEKIVLARRTEYEFDRVLDPMLLLTQLQRYNSGCYAFMYQPKDGTAFISVTPERLFMRKGDALEIDAVSSTLPRGGTSDQDRIYERDLLNNDKLRREHQIVIDGIVSAITPQLKMPPVIGATAVLKLERIQHLSTLIQGNLITSVSDDDIIKALHPTPAVGGQPRLPAIDMIAQLEPFNRGWYAAPIGIISPELTEIAVGIRSLLIRGKTVSVFTGAGIVAGSEPEAEWLEIDSKDILRPLLSEQVTA